MASKYEKIRKAFHVPAPMPHSWCVWLRCQLRAPCPLRWVNPAAGLPYSTSSKKPLLALGSSPLLRASCSQDALRCEFPPWLHCWPFLHLVPLVDLLVLFTRHEHGPIPFPSTFPTHTEYVGVGVGSLSETLKWESRSHWGRLEKTEPQDSQSLPRACAALACPVSHRSPSSGHFSSSPSCSALSLAHFSPSPLVLPFFTP